MMARPVPGFFFPVAAILLLAAVAAPIIAVLVTLSPAEVGRAFSEPQALSALRVSFEASLCATGVAAVLGVPAGYWLARAPRVYSIPLLFVLALPLAFPPVASGILLLSVLHGTPIPDSLAGVAVAEFFVSGSFVAIASSAAFGAADPIYEEAARTLGVSEWRIFLAIALPAAAGSVLAGIAFAWLRAIGEYGATSVLAYHPSSLPVALYVALSASGVRAALALTYGFVVLAAIVVAIAWILRRRVVE
ncbi:MAG: ABC transporter permease subunit [Candidatus Eremiobacteraeota bacterium]|nr:ABC transporter permease subunit [Candidatus Eremiobacteraeota bacterium]